MFKISIGYNRTYIQATFPLVSEKKVVSVSLRPVMIKVRIDVTYYLCHSSITREKRREDPVVSRAELTEERQP